MDSNFDDLNERRLKYQTYRFYENAQYLILCVKIVVSRIITRGN